MTAGGAAFVLGSLLQATSPEVVLLVIGRVMLGIGIGFANQVFPTCIALRRRLMPGGPAQQAAAPEAVVLLIGKLMLGKDNGFANHVHALTFMQPRIRHLGCQPPCAPGSRCCETHCMHLCLVCSHPGSRSQYQSFCSSTCISHDL